jgi:propane monooxygenase reductase subunit
MDHVQSGERRPVRFFYGARTQADLFNLDEFAMIARDLADFEFIPALSHADDDASWTGERGFVHDVVARYVRAHDLGDDMDAYSCGPPPMIDAVLPVLQMAGVEPEHIYFDKFTPAVR